MSGASRWLDACVGNKPASNRPTPKSGISKSRRNRDIRQLLSLAIEQFDVGLGISRSRASPPVARHADDPPVVSQRGDGSEEVAVRTAHTYETGPRPDVGPVGLDEGLHVRCAVEGDRLAGHRPRPALMARSADQVLGADEIGNAL